MLLGNANELRGRLGQQEEFGIATHSMQVVPSHKNETRTQQRKILGTLNVHNFIFEV